MIHAKRRGQATPPAFGGSGAGDTFTGISYGDDIVCPTCGQLHPIQETQQIYEITRMLVEQIEGAIPMMIGILRDRAGTYVAACSPAEGTPGYQAFLTAIQTKRAFLPQLRVTGDLQMGQLRTRGGDRLSGAQVRACTVLGQPIAGRCAAPKLIHYAMSNDLPRPWVMSEVMHDPTGQNRHHASHVTAESCQTCARLLPLMLCGHTHGEGLLTFRGLMQRQWQGF
jgi:hypothetical protein